MVLKDALVNELRTRLDLTKDSATETVDTVLESIIDLVAEHDKLKLTKFGTFEKRVRAARKGKHPQSGEEIQIAESVSVGFKPLKDFKDAVK